MADDMASTGATVGYLTPERIMMRDMARDFVREVVLPTANRLDPIKGDMPARTDRPDGRAGLLRHPDPGGVRRPRPGRVRILPGGRGAGARLDERRQRHRPRQQFLPLDARRGRGAASQDRGRWPRAATWAPRPCRNRAPARTSPACSCRARRDGDEWVITGNKYWCTFADGADYISVLCRIDDPERAGGRAGTTSISVEKPKGELPEDCTGSPIPKIGYFGWKTWELRFDDVRAPARQTVSGNPEAGDGAARRRFRPRPRPRPHRGPLDRPGAGRAGGCDRLRQGARPVRPADLRLPGHPLQDRHHGHRDRGGAPADVSTSAPRSTPAAPAGSRPRWSSCSPPRCPSG